MTQEKHLFQHLLQLVVSVLLLSLQTEAVAAEEPASRSIWFWPSPLPAGVYEDTIRVPGTDISAGIGGFVRVYSLLSDISLDRNTRAAQQLDVSKIPVTATGSDKGSRSNLHAKESRIWLKGYRSTRFGELGALAEYDLSESASNHAPRLRHAYATLGGMLVGQTYSTFTNTSALADIEAAIAVGNSVTRQPMLRWTQALGETPFQLMLALESAESKLVRGDSTTITTTEHQANPDIVLRINRLAAWGTLSVAVMSRRIEVKDPGPEIRDSDRGNALSLAGRINTGTLNNVRFMFSYGNALARYVTASTYADAIIAADGRHSLTTVHSGMVAYQHYWHYRLRSTLSLSYSRADLPAWASNSLTRGARTSNVNLIWAASAETSLGIEYMHAIRELKDGRDGELNRVLLSLRFNF